MPHHAESRTVITALDGLPYGDLNAPEATGRVKKCRLPEGVSKKRLLRDVILIAWPSFVELLLTQLTTMADQVMVGRLPGEEGVRALSAVGLAGMPKFLLMTMIIAMNVGTTAIVARCRGQQNQEKANQVFRQALVLNLVMSTVFMCVGLLSAEWMIVFMGGTGIAPETLQLGIQYLKIQLYGFIPLTLGVTVTAALRGVGDTTTPMIYNTVANVVNLFFNYVMIYGKLGFPAMGVAGASLATVVGQTVAFFIAMYVSLSKKHYVYLDLRKKFTFDWGIMKNVASIGLPSIVEQLFMRAGVIIFLRLIASLGDTMYATHQILINIQSMSFMVGQAFGNASTTLMGQSIGKRRYDMAMIYTKNVRMCGLYVSLFMLVLMALFRGQLIALYNTQPAVIAAGAPIMFLVALAQPVQSDQFIVSGGLRGAGDTKYSAFVLCVTTLIVRSILCIIAVNVLHWGLFGAWIAMFSDQVLRSLLMAMRYTTGKWKLKMRTSAVDGPAQA